MVTSIATATAKLLLQCVDAMRSKSLRDHVQEDRGSVSTHSWSSLYSQGGLNAGVVAGSAAMLNLELVPLPAHLPSHQFASTLKVLILMKDVCVTWPGGVTCRKHSNRHGPDGPDVGLQLEGLEERMCRRKQTICNLEGVGVLLRGSRDLSAVGGWSPLQSQHQQTTGKGGAHTIDRLASL